MPVRLTGQAAGDAAAAAAGLLGSAPPPVALRVLDWAAASELSLSDAELEEFGRTRLNVRTRAPELTALLRHSPAIRRGLLTRLAGEPPDSAEALFESQAGAAIGRDDLAAYPRLTELWLIHAAARGEIGPMRALDEISDIRALTGQGPRMDGELLRRLWPGGCPPEQVAALLGAVTGPPAADVLNWLSAQIGAAVASGMLDAGSRAAGPGAGRPSRLAATA